jgi:hypothetical protein
MTAARNYFSHPPAEIDALGYSLPLVKRRATD